MANHQPILVAMLFGVVVVMGKFCSESNFVPSIMTAEVSNDGNAAAVPMDSWVAQVHKLPKNSNGYVHN